MNKTTIRDDHNRRRSIPLVQFSTDQEDWAVAYRDISEILAVKTITPVPKTPPFVAGIVHKRGIIITVLDFTTLLGNSIPPQPGVRIIRLAHNAMEVGLLVRSRLVALTVPAAAVERAEKRRLQETGAAQYCMVTRLTENGQVLNLVGANDVVAFFSACFGAKDSLSG